MASLLGFLLIKITGVDRAVIERWLAGVVQTHLQRVMGMNFMEVQEQLHMFYVFRLGAGITVVIGAALFLYATFGPVRAQVPVSAAGAPARS